MTTSAAASIYRERRTLLCLPSSSVRAKGKGRVKPAYWERTRNAIRRRRKRKREKKTGECVREKEREDSRARARAQG